MVQIFHHEIRPGDPIAMAEALATHCVTRRG
jgi:hypothetical protein